MVLAQPVCFGDGELVCRGTGSPFEADVAGILVRFFQFAIVSIHTAALVRAPLHLVPIPVEDFKVRSASTTRPSRSCGRDWLSGRGLLRLRSDSVRAGCSAGGTHR